MTRQLFVWFGRSVSSIYPSHCDLPATFLTPIFRDSFIFCLHLLLLLFSCFSFFQCFSWIFLQTNCTEQCANMNIFLSFPFCFANAKLENYTIVILLRYDFVHCNLSSVMKLCRTFIKLFLRNESLISKRKFPGWPNKDRDIYRENDNVPKMYTKFFSFFSLFFCSK